MAVDLVNQLFQVTFFLNKVYLIGINDQKRCIGIVKKVNDKISLYDTAIVSANDELVNLFINKKIKFNDIQLYLLKILNYKEILKLRSKLPKNYNQIKTYSEYVRLKTRSLCI